MQHGAIFLERQTFVGMPHRMAEVQRLADTLLFRILPDYLFLDGHRLRHQLIQIAVVHGVNIVQHDGSIDLHRADQAVFYHLGIARKYIVAVQSPQKFAVDKDTQRGVKCSDLVLQPVKIDARLSANRRIDRGHQRSWYVDRPDTALERSSGKAAHVCHHSPAQIQEQGVARSPFRGQLRPNR